MDELEFRKRIREHWEKNIQNGYVYHGTSKLFEQNVLEEGLKPEGFWKHVPKEAFDKIMKYLYGSSPSEYFEKDVKKGVFVTHSVHNAEEYATAPFERIHVLLEEALHHYDRMPKDVKNALRELGGWYLRVLESGGVVFGIRMKHLVPHIEKEGELGQKVAKAIMDFEEYYRSFVVPYVRYLVEEEGITKQKAFERVLNILKKEDPVRTYFFNKAVNAHVFPAAIEKVRDVPPIRASEELLEPERRFLERLRRILQKETHFSGVM